MPDTYDSLLIEPAADLRLALLQDLRARIIPQQLYGEFKALLADRTFDVLTPFDPDLLLSPLSQICAAPESTRWLKMVAEAEPEKFASASCPHAILYRNNRTANPAEVDYRSTVVKGELASFLFFSGKKPAEIAEIEPKLLGATVSDEYNRKFTLLFQALQTSEDPIAALDGIAAATGNADFIYTRNERGETPLHFIAQQSVYAEDKLRIDVVSWMLQKKPLLANEPDRFGWTPLDRYVSQNAERLDTSMVRLLIASGAALEKQIAPKFNFAAELAKRDAQRLDKPATPKSTLKPGP